MYFKSILKIRFLKRLIPFAGLTLVLPAMALVFGPLSSSQLPYRPPTWSVQSTDPAHNLLTLKGTQLLGVDTSMVYIVQFRIQGTGANQLASFQPNMAVTLESSPAQFKALTVPGATTGGKAQSQTKAVAKSPTVATAFTGIPTPGQTLWIQASGMSPIEGIVVNVANQTSVAGQPGAPCCAVTAFNAQTGVATAKVNPNGQIFMFQAPMREGPPPGPGQAPPYLPLSSGQPVWANLTSGQVSLDGKTPCCQITAEGTSISSGPGGKPASIGVNKPAVATPACCEITSLNQQTKTLSAKVKSNGQAFQIAVANPTLFQSLRIGQAIWANFKTQQVSLNGLGPIDGMQITGSVSGPLVAHLPATTFKKPPYTAIPSPSSPPLTIHDHTLIMQAVIQNRAYLLQKISHHNWQHATRRQNVIGAMFFLIESPSVSESTKERIRVAVQLLRRARWSTSSSTDSAFRQQASAGLRTASNPSSAFQALNNLEQKYRMQAKYITTINMAKALLDDGTSTIYSRTWLTQNIQASRSGGGITNADIPLTCGSGGGQGDSNNPAGGDDLGVSCLDGGGSPYPGEGGCDPSTDPNCGPPPPPDCTADPTACNNCPDPTNPDCNVPPPPPPPDCASDPTNPDCPPPPPPMGCTTPDCSGIAPAPCNPEINPGCDKPIPGCTPEALANWEEQQNSQIADVIKEDAGGALVAGVGGAFLGPVDPALVVGGGVAASLWAVIKTPWNVGGFPCQPSAAPGVSTEAGTVSAGFSNASVSRRRPDLQPVLTQVDPSTAVVTARTPKGNFFQFRITEPGQLSQLKPGMPVHVQLSTQRAFVSVGGQQYTFPVIHFWPSNLPFPPPNPANGSQQGVPSPSSTGAGESQCFAEARQTVLGQFSEGQTSWGDTGPYPYDPPGFEDAYATCMRKHGN